MGDCARKHAERPARPRTVPPRRTRQAGLAAPGASAGEPRGEPGRTEGIRRGSRATPVGLAITIATVLALGLRLYQLTRPGYLLSVTEYDDGPYFGSALRLVSGVLPYRDFLLVQPPGITLLMIPP